MASPKQRSLKHFSFPEGHSCSAKMHSLESILVRKPEAKSDNSVSCSAGSTYSTLTWGGGRWNLIPLSKVLKTSMTASVIPIYIINRQQFRQREFCLASLIQQEYQSCWSVPTTERRLKIGSHFHHVFIKIWNWKLGFLFNLFPLKPVWEAAWLILQLALYR